MTATARALTGLRRDRPEWSPWLAVVDEIVRETGTPVWEAAVPAAVERGRTCDPLLAGATLALDTGVIRHLFKRLIRTASQNGSAGMAALGSVLDADPDPLALFVAALCHDGERVEAVANASGVEVEALHAVVALVPVPFLQACHRRWAPSVPESWGEGYCPVCGSWPAFAEVRGIERSRCLRCGRCGAAWHAHTLRCPYCGTNDHHQLVALVPEKGGAQAVIEACRRCLGYVKTFTRLQGCAPGAVMLEDLATVDLDVAALEQGYARPTGAGHSFEVAVVGNR